MVPAPFFEHIEQWLEYKFKDSSELYLNPVLGRSDTLAADADLLIDSALYEIKTVKDPAWYIENEYHQLFGYVSLFENQKNNNISSLHSWKDLDTIGFIFPLHLQEITMDISSWTKKERLEFFNCLDYFLPCQSLFPLLLPSRSLVPLYLVDEDQRHHQPHPNSYSFYLCNIKQITILFQLQLELCQ